MADLQHPQPSRRDHIAQALYPAGLILAALGALLHLRLPMAGAWTLFAGGLALLVSHILSARTASRMGQRDRRLVRMNFLGSALYLIAGGAAVEGRTLWILFFIVGTVFVAYTVFALGRKRSDEEK